MKTLIAAVACIALTGCAALRSSDDPVKIRWVRADTAAEAKKLCVARHPHLQQSKVVGCVYWELNGTCVIVAPDVPDGHERYGVLGHEAKHCFDGLFHGQYKVTRGPLGK